MRFYCVLFSLLLLTVIAPCQTASSYKLTSGFVPDSKTAIAVAEAVLIPVYGKEHVEDERPFTATLKHDVWIVEGTLYCPDGKGEMKTTDCSGGVAVVKISKSDGRILYMLHGK